MPANTRTGPPSLVADVRYVACQADGMCLGVEFDPRGTDNCLDKAEDIIGFVMQCLRPPQDS